MNRFLAISSLVLFSFSVLGNEPKISLEQYIESWKDIAVNQMLTHGIPASITISQGILESGFGNSKLAIQANNHFGIKCHSWSGDTFLKDDDKKNECFRKYINAAQSYEDHSKFLTSRSRYASLFELDITDYKSWAKGLKDAGYATNPNYPKRLIDIIEKHNLDKYDNLSTNELIVESNPTSEQVEITIPGIKEKLTAKKQKVKKNKKREIHTNSNRTKYVIAGKHDTFYLISKEFGYSLHQMNRWNDFPSNKDVLFEGDKIYIMRKRRRINSDIVQRELQANKKPWKISQEHGIQLKSLLEIKTLSSPNMALSKDK